MRILLASTVAMMLLHSCSPKILPGETIIVTKDSIIEKRVPILKDTIIYKAADSVVLHDTIIDCPDAEYHKEVTSTSGKIKAVVDISKGKINVNCKSDSLQQRIEWLEWELIKEKYVTREKTIIRNVPVKEPIPYIPKWVWYLLTYSVALTGYVFRKQFVKLFKLIVTLF